jgi:hypothetical protein
LLVLELKVNIIQGSDMEKKKNFTRVGAIVSLIYVNGKHGRKLPKHLLEIGKKFSLQLPCLFSS